MTRETKLPSIPETSGIQDSTIRRFLDAVKLWIETHSASRPNADQLDRLITWRQLLDNGIVERASAGSVGGSWSYVLSPGAIPAVTIGGAAELDPDYTPPPPVTGLTTSVAVSLILITWDYPEYSRSDNKGSNHAFTEIWRAPAGVGGSDPGLGNAVLIGSSPHSIYADDVGATGLTYYYWARNVSLANVAGPFNAVGGTQAIAQIAVEDVLSILTGQITESQLAAALNTRINLIDGNDQMAGSVAYQVAQEAAARVAAISQEVTDRNAAILVETNNRISAINTEISNRIADVDAEEAARIAAINSEATTRSDADTAEANSRTQLATQLRGSYEGTDITLVTTGLIFEERTARSNADSSEASQRSALATQIRGGYTGSDLAQLSAGLLYDERQARSSADSSEVTAREALSTKVTGAADPSSLTLGTLSSGLLYDERESRSSADSSEVSARQTLATKVIGTTDPTGVTLANLSSGLIYDEKTARSSADSSEVTARQSLAATLTGFNDPSGKVLSDLVSGIIYEEKSARVTQDNSLSTQISLISAGVAGGFDSARAWYFDSGTESWTGTNNTVTQSGGWLRGVSTSSDPSFKSPTGLAVQGSKYAAVKVRVRKVSGSDGNWEGYCWYRLVGDAADTWTSAQRKQVTPAPTWDGNGIATINFDFSTDSTWTGGTIDQIRLDMGGAGPPPPANAETYEFDFVALGRDGPGASTAALADEATARASADSAEVTARQNLSTKVTGAADPASLTLGTLTQGLIYDEKTARSSADSAEVTARESLSAVITGFNDPTGKTLGDLTTGLIYSEKSARVSADDANASSISGVSARLNNFNSEGVTVETKMTATASRVTGLEGQYSVKIDNTGYVAGFGLANAGIESGSEFIVLADRFGIVATGNAITINSMARSSNVVTATFSGTGHGLLAGDKIAIGKAETSYNGAFVVSTAVEGGGNTTVTWAQTAPDDPDADPPGYARKQFIPFVVGTVGGRVLVGIDGATIKDASIQNAAIANLSADKITTGLLGAAYIGAGTIGAHVINVGGTALKIDGGTRQIRVHDGVRDRVTLGDLGGGAYGITIVDAGGGTILSSGGNFTGTLGGNAISSHLNSNIAVNGSGQITGIGTGNNTAVANSQILVNGSGQLTGIGTAGITVDNAQQLWSQVMGTGKPQDYATATGLANMILNGSAELGSNANFSNVTYGMTYDATDGVSGLGCFKQYGINNERRSDALIPVDTSERYETSLWTRTGGESGGGINRQYAGVACFDKNGNVITYQGCYWRTGTRVQLYEGVSAGATSFKINKPSTPWIVGTNYYVMWNVAADGSDLPKLLSTNITHTGTGASVDTSNPSYDLITMVGTTVPVNLNAGDWVANTVSGSGYTYCTNGNVNVPTTWTKYTGYVTGVNGFNAAPTNNQFRIGTKYVKFLLLCNRDIVNGGGGTNETTYIDEAILRPMGTRLASVADNATRNQLSVSASAPSNPVDGDLWYDTTALQWKVRSGAAWTSAGELNSKITIDGSGILQGIGTASKVVENTKITISGGNLSGIGTGNGTAVANSVITIDGSGVLQGIGTGSKVVDNTKITINANGSLSGAGSGSVTIAGLGFTGALDATKNVFSSGPSAHANPTTGDLWYDTSASPAILKRYNGSTWDSWANYITNSNQITDGAGWSTTANWTGVTGRPSDLADLDGTRATKLDGVATGATKNLVTSGTLAARPAGADGDFYYATDTYLLYQKVGGAWITASNNYTNTNQLTDGALLGQTALWTGVSSRPQLLDPSTWVVGTTGAQTNFSNYGTASLNSIVADVGPYGTVTPLWRTSPTTSGAHGFQTSNQTITPSKGYRYSCWFRKVSGGPCTIYMGAALQGGSTQTAALGAGDTPDTNPYFATINSVTAGLVAGRWYFMVGYLFPSQHTGTTNYSKVYDGTTGQPIGSITTISYKSLAAATYNFMRTFQIPAGGVTDSVVDFSNPRMDVLNGMEVSVEALLAGATSVLNSNISLSAAGVLTGGGTSAQVNLSQLPGSISNAQLAGSIDATKLAITTGGMNLVFNSSFEVDSDANGVADGWAAYNNSSGTEPTTPTVQTSGGVFQGGKFQRVAWAVNNTTRKGVSLLAGGLAGGWQTSTTYIVSWYAKASGTNIGKTMGMFWNTAPSSTVTLLNPTLTSSWQRYAFKITWGGSVEASGRFFVSIQDNSQSTGDLDFDAVQVEQGDLLTAYAPRPDEILASTITATEIADNAVTTNKLIANAVTAAKIATGTITANEIAGSTITGDKIAGQTITAAKLVAGTITSNEIASNTIVAGNIQAGAINSTSLFSGAIITNALLASDIDAGKLTVGTLAAGRIAAGSLDGDKITAGTITATQLGANSVIAGKINAGAINSSSLFSGQIITNALLANDIDAAKITAGTLSAARIAAGTITADKLKIGPPSDNLAQNPVFADGTTAGWRLWTGGAQSVLANTAPGVPAGAPSLYVMEYAAGGTRGYFNGEVVYSDANADQHAIQCYPGQKYEVRLAIAKAAGSTWAANGFRVICYWHKADGTYNTSNDAITLSDSGVTTGWLDYSGIVTVPANTYGFNIYVYGASIATAAVYWTNLRANRISGSTLIEDGAIIADKIATNAVTSTKILAGEINAGHIAAGAITTPKLLVQGGGGSITPDPNTQDIAAWSGSGISIATDSTSPSGLTALACTAAASQTVLCQSFPIDETKNYVAEFWARQVSGTNNAFGVVSFCDSNGVNIQGSTNQTWPSWGTYHYYGLTGGQPPGTWTKYSIEFGPAETAKIPAGTKLMKVGVLANYNASVSGTQHFTGFRVREKVTGALIVDGTIQAAHIQAGTITSGLLASGAVIAGKIQAGAIDAANIIANGVITGTQIANSTITNSLLATGIDAGKITVGTLDAARINAGTITADKLGAGTIGAYTILVGSVESGASIALDGSTKTIVVNDGTRNRVTLGKLGANNYGLLLADANGATIADATGFYRTSMLNAPDFFDNFETTTTGFTANWQNYNGAGEASIESVADSVTGGKVLRVGNNSGVDEYRPAHRRLIPFNADATYRIRARVRRTAGSGSNLFIGFLGVAADGTTLVSYDGTATYGNAYYHCVNSGNPGSSWTLYEGYTKGFGAPNGTTATGTLASPGKVHTSVRYLRPIMILNLGAAGTTEVDYFEVSILTDQATTILNQGGFATLNQINSGNVSTYIASAAIDYARIASVDAATISTGTLAAARIASNSIDATKLNVSQLSAINAAAGTLTSGAITVGSNGYIRQGQTAFDTGTGWWLGDVSGTPKFSLGSSTKGFVWDGSNLTVRGDLIATGNIVNDAVTGIYQSSGTSTANFSVTIGSGQKLVLIGLAAGAAYYNAGYPAHYPMTLKRDTTVIANFTAYTAVVGNQSEAGADVITQTTVWSVTDTSTGTFTFSINGGYGTVFIIGILCKK